MAAIDDLKAWFERDLRFATWDENVTVDDSDPNKLDVRFYTDTNEYALTILTEDDDPPNIDAVVRSRKARAGQAAPRVRRLLSAGRNRLNERAWRRILGGIVGLELVRVHRRGATEKTDEPDEQDMTGRVRLNRERIAGAAGS